MKLHPPQTLESIAKLIDAEFLGEPDFAITGVNEIHMVESGDLVFVDHPKYYNKALNSAATTVLIDKRVECPEGKALIISEQPFRDFNRITQHFYQFTPATTQISEAATIGVGTVIQPGVFIGDNVKIGKNCLVHSHVTLYDNTVIGDNVIIHANVVVGSDAFYFQKKADGYQKLLTCGSVVIEDDVEIGASCTIDKGVTAETVIGQGSKLDNQVHVGHDTIIGKRCLIAAQTGISGCVVIEDDVTIWGQVGIAHNAKIGQGANILAQSGIRKTVAAKQVVFGTPADDASLKMKEMIFMKRLVRGKEKIAS